MNLDEFVPAPEFDALGWYPWNTPADKAAGMVPMSGTVSDPTAGIGAQTRRYGAEIPLRALR